MSDTKPQVVADGVSLFAAVEADIPAAQSSVLALKDVIDRGIALSMAPSLQGIVLKAKIDAIIGKLASALADTFDLHNTVTKIAQNSGVDVAHPNGGGTRPTY